ncbi:hypothetical protein KA037_00625 [Patescibacteria group bacterium]|nr:hypothetical protein [Patescibacteria group bacterium]MBP7841169.1 hypothetical protein [Patescibacteria group bacterium]
MIKHKTLISNEAPKTIIDKTETVKINLDAKELFANARKILDDNKNKELIKTFDNVSKDIVLGFLAAAKNLDGNGIDHQDYVSALNAIKDKLTKHVNNKDFTTLLENTKDEELVYIVNRLKAIFAENYLFKSAADVQKVLKDR